MGGVPCNNEENEQRFKRRKYRSSTTTTENKPINLRNQYSLIETNYNNINLDLSLQIDTINPNKEQENNNKNCLNENNIINIALKAHNIIREKNGVKPLILNQELCELAQKYADLCSETENIDHCPFLYKGNSKI